ncbi:MAG: homocysteine biosynthesis protein, partial [Dehalococcoidia bacterium]
PVIDYSDAFPNNKSDIITHVSYAELKSGTIKVNGREVPTSSRSSYPRAVEITRILKEWIESGEFLLTEAVAPLPGIGSGVTQNPFKERQIED